MEKRVKLYLNLKANFSLVEFRSWMDDLLPYLSVNSKILNYIEITIIPSYHLLYYASARVNKSGLSINVWAQDISPYENGEHTGSVSASMLREIASGVVIGHSEARKELQQARGEIIAKMERVREAGMDFLLCVGEREEPRSRDEVLISASNLAKRILAETKSVGKFNLAYEPIWAIGGQFSAGAKYVNFIKNYLMEKNANIAQFTYGGSVNDSNIEAMLEKGIEGFLVGGASLNVQEKLIPLIEVTYAYMIN